MNNSLLKTGAAALVAACGLMTAGTADAAQPRNGREVYEAFRAGLAEPSCPTEASRWSRQFSHAPDRLTGRDETLVLFSHVVESLRAAHLPTEYALIPFVESGYSPTARSSAGPAGLWQMIGTTARNHNVPMRAGYDGRMSPVDSTKAAVRYLKTLHGMFGGNWRLAVMAYNAGEYRVFGALKRAGQTPRTAKPESLTGLSGITQAYDDKLHAISCDGLGGRVVGRARRRRQRHCRNRAWRLRRVPGRRRGCHRPASPYRRRRREPLDDRPPLQGLGRAAGQRKRAQGRQAVGPGHGAGGRRTGGQVASRARAGHTTAPVRIRRASVTESTWVFCRASAH